MVCRIDPSNKLSVQARDDAFEAFATSIEWFKENNPEAKDWKGPRLEVKVITVGGRRCCGNHQRTIQTARRGAPRKGSTMAAKGKGA